MTLTAAPYDGEPTVAAMLAQPGPRAHIVEFHDDDDRLCERVAHYLAAGLRAGELVVVIATEAHREALARRLDERGEDAAAAAAAGRLVMLDAHEALAAIMVDGQPSASRFRDHVGGALERARGGGAQRVRAFGEMVDVLWRRGEQQAALRLEGLWNELAAERELTLLCAYVMGNFYKAGDRESFDAVCRAHTAAIPTERSAGAAESAQEMRALATLEQRARALEHEIAQRTEIEAALREALDRELHAREAAERSVRFNELFARMLGHDLRNPLGAISMGASYVARSSTNEKITRSATRILSSADRMARMVEQLLDFSQLRDGGGPPLHTGRADLADLCARVKEEIEAAHPEGVIAIELDGDAVGEWDVERMLRVLSTLVDNAVVHGAPGGGVTIQLDGRDATRVAVAVHNAGEIAAEKRAVLFEPMRGSNRHHHTRGLGLGLFLTRQVVQAHGGTVEVASSAAAGTTFALSLPRAAPGSAAPESAAPGSAAPGSAAP